MARQAANTSTLTVQGSIVGTPYYMSPEQATADPSLDGRSDLYSLGVVGYELLSGKRPFDGDSVQGILTQHVLTPPPSLALAAPEAPPLLVQAIERCLQKQPDQRWRDGKAFRDALQWREGTGLESQMPLGAEKLPSIGIAGAAIVAGLTVPVLAALASGATTLTRIPPWSKWMFVVGAVVLPALLVLNSALPARAVGWSWSKILGIAFLEPEFWITWWPRGARRPGSVWDRLPRPVRLARGLQGWVAIGALLLFLGSFLVMRVTSPGGDLPAGLEVPLALGTLIAGIVILLGPLIGAIGLVHWFGRKAGLPSHAVLKLLNASNTSALWERPEISRILVPIGAAGAGGEPKNAAELVARIEGLAAELPGNTLARDAVDAARRLARALQGLDAELAQIAKDLDPAQLAQVERQLAGMETGEDTGSRRQMRELLEGQRKLLKQLAAQHEFAERRREHLTGLLQTLWLQLASLRAGTARQQIEDAAVSGKVRDVVQEIAAHVSATEEIQAAMATIQTPR
ncbi:MAG TPA: protein kinase, partial [Gemmatimonadales bacterium]|nr:protein kinase [Gemmatimonadales bacterium]